MTLSPIRPTRSGILRPAQKRPREDERDLLLQGMVFERLRQFLPGQQAEPLIAAVVQQGASSPTHFLSDSQRRYAEKFFNSPFPLDRFNSFYVEKAAQLFHMQLGVIRSGRNEEVGPFVLEHLVTEAGHPRTFGLLSRQSPPNQKSEIESHCEKVVEAIISGLQTDFEIENPDRKGIELTVAEQFEKTYFQLVEDRLSIFLHQEGIRIRTFSPKTPLSLLSEEETIRRFKEEMESLSFDYRTNAGAFCRIIKRFKTEHSINFLDEHLPIVFKRVNDHLISFNKDLIRVKTITLLDELVKTELKIFPTQKKVRVVILDKNSSALFARIKTAPCVQISTSFDMLCYVATYLQSDLHTWEAIGEDLPWIILQVQERAAAFNQWVEEGEPLIRC